MRIAHLSAEVAPFAKTGGLGDVVGALPKAERALGHDVAVWMPYHRLVRKALEKRGTPPEWVCDPFTVDVAFRQIQVGLLRTTLPGSDVPVMLVGCDPYFDRPHVYSSGPGGKDDGVARFTVFVRAALEGMRRLRMVPDVINAHDWHAALAPIALAYDRPRDWHFERTATVLTVHNMAYQGVSGKKDFVLLGIPPDRWPQLEWDSALNLMKGALLAADRINAVSPTFSYEISTKDGGFGLDPIVRMRGRDVGGILNGIDPHEWSPATDSRITATYDVDTIEAKRENRRALLARAGMNPDDSGFVVGIVTRLTSQKGIDLLLPVVGDLLGRGIRFVLVGSGDSDLESKLRDVSHRAAGRFWAWIGFSEELAHWVEAGADAFLMPSRFEPCGLNQMYSLAYGTPPIVRRVGGLADTVIGFDGTNGRIANGFTFGPAEPWALASSVLWAERCYRDPLAWTNLVRNGMSRDFSWERSAERYVGLYEDALRRKR